MSQPKPPISPVETVLHRGERCLMTVELGTALAKKFPIFGYILFLWNQVSVAELELDRHLALRVIGACMGGAVTFLRRDDLVVNRRVACLMLGVCGGIGLGPFVRWLVSLGFGAGIPDEPFGLSFLVSLACVKGLEQLADDPFRFVRNIASTIRNWPTSKGE
jgi:hypothetical protein